MKHSTALRTLLLVVVLVLPTSAWPAAVQSQQPEPLDGAPAAEVAPPLTLPDNPEIAYAPGTLLVRVRPDVVLTTAPAGENGVTAAAVHGNAPLLASVLPAFGATRAEPLWVQSSVSAAGSATPGAPPPLAGLYRVTLAPDADVPMAAAAIAADPAVLYAEPDYVAYPTAPLALTPNDPELAQQWALARIGMPAAWETTTGDPAVVIAFVDSGIDATHPEFAGRLWQNDDPPGNGDDDQNTFVDDTNGWNFVTRSRTLTDANGHGTQVAGVAAATGNNGAGIAGLCWQCRVMFVNAMQANGAANYSDIALAVVYASSNNAQVINLSLGGYADSQTLRDAIAEASTTALVVAGAGNDDSSTPFYPAAYPQVLAVAATDDQDAKWVGSNHGPWVDVSAPGAAIRTTALGSGYATNDGTSLSAAFVSGLAGLLKSRNPTWTPEQIRWQILNTAAPIAAPQMGAGRINAQAALVTAAQPQLEFAGYSIDGVASARPTPGQSLQLVVTLRNTWLPASNLNATLTSSDPYVSIPDAAGAFGLLASGATASNTATPFAVTLAGNTPYSRNLAFVLNLTGSGGYAASVPLTVQVRSSMVVLGNTQYSVNTVWTNDKTYVLDGSVIVAEGVTLTIQPGTVVKVAPDKFIRIDGTLIADGTAEQPIAFTWKTEGQAPWGGILFTELSSSATLSSSSAFVAGSLIRHADIAHAYYAAVRLAGNAAPYFDSVYFHDNSDAALVIATGAPFITHSRFERNGRAVDSTGRATIVHNEFRNNAKAVLGGFALVKSNNFVDQTWFAVGSCNAENATIEANSFSGNGVDIQIYAVGSLAIRGNTISSSQGAGSGGICSFMDSGSSMFIEHTSSAQVLIEKNTVVQDSVAVLSLSRNSDPGTYTIRNNNFITKGPVVVRMAAGSHKVTVDATGNYWGLPTAELASHFVDCTFDANGCGASAIIGKVIWNPPLSTPDPDAPAYITNFTMSPNPVGLETGTLTVEFSRAMDTSVAPTIQFWDARRGAVQTVTPQRFFGAARDARGGLWFNSGSSLRSYDGNVWLEYPIPNGLAAYGAVFASRSGDVFASVDGFSRFRNGQWEPIPNSPDISKTGMAEDAQGSLVVVSTAGQVLRFNGTVWEPISPYMPQLAYLAVDADGQIWVATYNTGENNSLYTLENGNFVDRTSKDGLPTGEVYALSSNLAGTVWLAVRTADEGVWLLSREGGAWHHEVTLDTNSYNYTGYGNTMIRDGSGRLWLVTNTSLWSCDGLGCKSIPIDGMSFEACTFDLMDHLWCGGSKGLQKQWQGAPFAMEGGAWTSPTRWRVTRSFSQEVPNAPYEVTVSGAVGSDGLAAASGAPYSFTVAYAGGVTTLPPLPPAVQVMPSASLNSLSVSWTPQGPGITQYRYAIGTTPGGRDIVGWTYSSTTNVTRSGLSLSAGRTYYVTVQARNSAGLWSANGVSNALIAGKAPPTPTPIPPNNVKIFLPSVSK